MADGTHIEWTDATWNPITGCAIVSPGCTNCYAMKLAGTRLKHIPSRAGLTIDTKAGPVWNGQVRLNEEWLDQPLKWKRPRKIFVCAHGDLFAENVPDEWIDRVFAVMALSPRHTFQVITKRARRMREYVCGFDCDGARRFNVADAAGRLMEEGDNAHDEVANAPWPLPNVWLGVSAEDQTRAEERIPELLAAPAAIRFVSAEPLIGPIDLLGTLARWQDNPARRSAVPLGRQLIDWIIVGGESGPGARPMHPEWARSIHDQCAAAGVAFHFKQWGAWEPATDDRGHHDGNMSRNGAKWVHLDGLVNGPSWHRDDGRQDTDPFAMIHVGKKAAGRLLDGVEHNGFPGPRQL